MIPHLQKAAPRETPRNSMKSRKAHRGVYILCATGHVKDPVARGLLRGGWGRIRTFEGARPTDLQSVLFDRFSTHPYLRVQLDLSSRNETKLSFVVLKEKSS